MRIGKRIAVCLLAAALLLSLFTGCGEGKRSDKLTIVVTIFPVYDWVKNLLGDRLAEVDLILLEDTGADLHNFQPTPHDIYLVTTCDVFIYVGGESDKWVDDVLAQATNQDMIVLNLLDELGSAARDEALLEGMEPEEEEEEDAKDEHIWLSPKNALLLCPVLTKVLQEKDPDNAETYRVAGEAYQKRLGDLDRAYTEAAAGAKIRTVLFADRFPFLYLVEDYGLTAYAAFSGCSAETEASPAMIRRLAEKVDSLGLRYVFVLENGNRRTAETVISESRAKSAQILEINSMQSVTGSDAENGADYIRIMESNLSVLKKALAG